MQKRRPLFPFQVLKYVAAGLIAVAVMATGATLWALRGDAIKVAERDAGATGTGRPIDIEPITITRGEYHANPN